MQTETVTREPIAVIGLGCVLPDAPDVAAFWDNLQRGRDSIREVPHDRWDPALYWAAEKTPDRTYAKIGAFVGDDAFNGLDYRMPPKVVEQIDPSQRWALSAARQALLDAGYLTGVKGDTGTPFDRDRCAVIIGNAMGGESNKLAAKRLFWPEARQAIADDVGFRGLPAETRRAILDRAEASYKSGTTAITEDTMPGHLSNIVAGRIANAFDLGGKNFTTDAACASSLAALDAAIDTLRKDEADLVLWGGSDRSMDITPYIEFSAIGALSPDGSRPFDKDANGFVMGEGCAMFVLKRLTDAERDGDKIYAVFRGVGGSSDGKGKGITAPNPIGQVKAVRRAYEDAGFEPATLGYLEAHGTSTPVGDPVELQSVVEAFTAMGSHAAVGSILVGSVKSNIGHLKAAAGAAGVLKAVLAVHHGRIPPSIHVKTLNPRIDWAASPFRVATELTDWPAPRDLPRRAAVSSFGFGGTNFHVVLEQHVPGRLVVAPSGAASRESMAASRESAARHERVPARADAAARTGVDATVSLTATVSPPAHAAPHSAPTALDLPAFKAHMATAISLEAEPLVLAEADVPKALALAASEPSFASTGAGPRLRDLLAPLTNAGLEAERRVAFDVAQTSIVAKKLETAQKAMTNAAAARLAFNQGVYLGAGAHEGKVAFLFPGQGTQYVNMGRDLAKKYAVVRHTFEEADEILVDELDGVKLTEILWPEPDTPEARVASEEKLKLTEFTQPAVLAMDVAILRLLRQWDVKPDVVAGHSLGEYGALVAAGVLSFADALHAVAARGREMAHVEVPDLGKMASISADWQVVQDAIADVDGYVICANKNCPSQTVIAGSSAGVDAAVAKLNGMGLQTMMLPVSAAFHSDIVAPASEPLRRVLGRLDVQAPRVRVLSNVGAAPYPDDPDAIRDNLAVQVASAVEWIGIIDRMYDEGVRTFIEVGPKRALSGFVADILKDKANVRPVFANHPKKGGIASINELFAFLGAAGLRPTRPAPDDAAVYTSEHRDPTAPFRSVAAAGFTSDATPEDPRISIIADKLTELSDALAQLRAPASAAASSVPPPAASSVALSVPSSAASSVASSGATATTAATPPDAIHVGANRADAARRVEALGLSLDDITLSGASIGLPGANKPLFDAKDWDRILAGENLITSLSEEDRARMVGKNIVRLVKGKDGQATFQPVSDMAQVIHLAARRGAFDLTDWGVGRELIEVLDKTSQYALAAGLEALRDAGIPLQRTYFQTSTGGFLPKAWRLPESLRDTTGVIFASAFPGYDNLVGELSRHLADRYAGRSLDDLQVLYNELTSAIEDEALRARVQEVFDSEFARLQDVLPDHGAARYEFNRKFLFSVLSMGHAQLAQFLGARGPNTQLNAACASTTQAVAVAEDWIRTGRCRRVLVVGADDATSPNLMEWIGSGFLASGAATTKSDVTEAALPFDRRRHGMIIGMGAVGLVVEAEPEVRARGMRPIAKLLATQVSNSAFHGSRLDVDHIASEMQALLRKATQRAGIHPETIADKTVFVSHETYTPARGGSAAAEIHALRATFGAAADKVVIANTKGFTGHPQGAGIEDAVALKMLQRGQVPPIPHLKEPDPELGDLRLSKGGQYDVRYALRLAAGFGSQVAMTLTELVAREDERVADSAVYDAWLAQVSGIAGAATEVADRTLRIVDQGPPARPAQRVPVAAAVAPVAAAPAPTAAPAPSAMPAPAMAAAPTAVPAPTAAADDVLAQVTAVVADKTGYPLDLLDPDLDLEADLGIDTVKQAELFADLRERFGVPLREDLQLKDYHTLRKVAVYMHGARAPTAPAPLAPAPVAAVPPAAPPAPSAALDPSAAAPPSAAAAPSAVAPPASGDVLGQVTVLVADKTGYPADLLEPDLDLEADLGIDTVKQAELFAQMRERFGVPLREDLQLKDYNTLRKVAQYMSLEGSQGRPAAGVPVGDVVVRGSAPPTAPSGGQPTARPDPQPVQPAAPHAAQPAQPAVLQGAQPASPSASPPRRSSQATFGPDAQPASPVPTAAPVPATITPASAATMTPVPATLAPPFATTARDGTIAAIRRLVPFPRAAPLPHESNDVAPGALVVLGGALPKAFAKAGFERAGPHEEPMGVLAWATRPGAVTPGDLFDVAKEHAASLRLVVVVTAQDGAHGLVAPRDADMAGLAGLAKALRKELLAVVKAIDLAPGNVDDGLALQETLEGGLRTEVAYDLEGVRHVIDIAPEPLADRPTGLAGKTLVVSGGAQGITVELLAAIASERPNLLLLGRTHVPEEAETWAKWDDAAWKHEEARVIAALRDAGEQPTPVKIRARVDEKRKAAEVWRTLDRLDAAGANVMYATVDVTDADAVARAVGRARDRFGAIHGVVHAAGVEISKALADKPREQFDLVYDVKAKGLDSLLAATEDDRLDLLVGFGSVAGRFGNIGQTDYSSANEAMAKRIHHAARTRRIPTAFTIAWGPWGEVGMATRGSVMTVLRGSGVTPIPTAEGVAAWLRELATPGVRECVVAGDLGLLDTDHQIVLGRVDPVLEAARQAIALQPERFRLLHGVTTFAAAQRVAATVRLDRARDPYLFDHAIDDVPLLPGVFGLEAFAEACALLLPDQTLLGADDVRFTSPLKQHKDAPVDATVTADIIENGDGARVACRLSSHFIGPDGQVRGEPRVHFEATLRFGAPRPPLHTNEVPECDGSIARDGIYPPFFHGPSFQVLAAAGPIASGEAVGQACAPRGPLFARGDAAFASHPMVTEALFQLCGLRTLADDETMSLPAGIERLDVYATRGAPDLDDVRLWCRYEGRVDGRRRFDAAACDTSGNVLVRLVGYTMVDLGPASAPVRRAVAASVAHAEVRMVEAEDGSDTLEIATRRVAIMTGDEADALDAALPALDGVVFAAVAVPDRRPLHDTRLTEKERTQLREFVADKRACDWAAGRLAAKRAARRAAPELTDNDVNVEQDPGSGAPILFVRGERSPAKISITHRDGVAIAAIGDDVVGVDLETVEERAGTWWHQAFTADENDHLRGQPSDHLAAAAAWAAKEACLKRAGTGLRASLHDLHVRLDGAGATVRGPWGEWRVSFWDLGGRVLAVTTPALDHAKAAPQTN